LGSKHNQNRPDAFAAGFNEVTSCILGNGIGVLRGVQQPGFNLLEAGFKFFDERNIGKRAELLR
jgi:hypothetical protein